MALTGCLLPKSQSPTFAYSQSSPLIPLLSLSSNSESFSSLRTKIQPKSCQSTGCFLQSQCHKILLSTLCMKCWNSHMMRTRNYILDMICNTHTNLQHNHICLHSKQKVVNRNMLRLLGQQNFCNIDISLFQHTASSISSNLFDLCTHENTFRWEKLSLLSCRQSGTQNCWCRNSSLEFGCLSVEVRFEWQSFGFGRKFPGSCYWGRQKSFHLCWRRTTLMMENQKQVTWRFLCC